MPGIVIINGHKMIIYKVYCTWMPLFDPFPHQIEALDPILAG